MTAILPKVWVIYTSYESDTIKGVYEDEKIAREALRMYNSKRSENQSDAELKEFEVFG